jgi:hypothetical protein
MIESQQKPAVSHTLPFDLRTALVRAASLPTEFERLKAIEQAERMGRERFPSKFQKED